MSWWTDFRDGLETAVAVVVNYFYPGAGSLGYLINSEGSQEQLRSTLGQLAMLGSGGFGAAAGNMANYGAALGSAAGTEGAIIPTAAEDSLQGQAALAAQQGGGDAGSTLGGMAGGTAADDSLQGSLAPAGTGGTGEFNTDYGAMNSQTPTSPGQVVGAVPGTEVGNAGQMGAGTNFFGNPNVSGTSTLGNTLSNTGKAVGAMPWGSPGNVSSMASGALGLLGSAYMNRQAQQAAMRADPFGPQRQYYADAMGRLAQNPSSIYTMPGYQAGEEAVRRNMAAQGFKGSGNMLAALQKYGGDFYNQTLNTYGQLAGAQFNPASAAGLGLGGTQSAIDLAGRSLGSLGYGFQMAGNQWPRFGG